MTRIIVREVAAEDLSAIKNLYSAWWIDAAGSPEDEQISFFTNRVIQSVKNNASQEKYLVATDESDALLGILGYRAQLNTTLKTFETTKNPTQLIVLMVNKDKVHEGVGTFLLRYFEDFAKRSMYSEILLTSSERWKDSWGFYEKMGYQDRGELPNTHDWHTRVFAKTFL